MRNKINRLRVPSLKRMLASLDQINPDTVNMVYTTKLFKEGVTVENLGDLCKILTKSLKLKTLFYSTSQLNLKRCTVADLRRALLNVRSLHNFYNISNENVEQIRRELVSKTKNALIERAT